MTFAEAVDSGRLDLPLPGSGRTAERFLGLMALGREDPVLARLGEGHADAVAILAELGGDPPRPGERWAVWAAAPASVTAVPASPAVPSASVTTARASVSESAATLAPASASATTAAPAVAGDGGWRLSGDRPWCSGAGTCTHALVTAAAPDGVRLFTVEVGGPRARPVDGTWPAVGMGGSDSRTVRFDDAPGRPVGGPGQYVNRPGFWHGGIGVAACWHGGAAGVADTLLAAARRRDVGPHALAHLGAVDVALGASRAALLEAAALIDAGPGADAHRLALRVRATAEQAATQVIDHVGRALGAGPLCRDEAHARRVADLTVYLRQSHAEADLAALGGVLTEMSTAW